MRNILPSVGETKPFKVDRSYQFLLVTTKNKKLMSKMQELKKMKCKIYDPDDEVMKQHKFYKVDQVGMFKLSPSPEENQIYLRHPYNDVICIPKAHYARIAMHLKTIDIQTLLLRLGVEELCCTTKVNEKKSLKAHISSPIASFMASIKTKVENTSTDLFTEGFKVDAADHQYLLKYKSDPSKEEKNIVFDEARIGEDINFFEDEDLQRIFKRRTGQFVSNIKCSRSFQEKATVKVAAQVAKIAGVSVEKSPERVISEELSATFFSKKDMIHACYKDIMNEWDHRDKTYEVAAEKGELFVKNENEKGWDDCTVELRGKTIHITVPGKEEVPYLVDQNRLAEDLEVLPDISRRSQNSKKFPISIPTVVEGKPKKLVIAAKTGREMWIWATRIRWLFEGDPENIEIPEFERPQSSSDHNDFYEEPQQLQERLLEMHTYKNFPKKAIAFKNFKHCFHKHQLRAGPTAELGAFAFKIVLGSCIQRNEKCFEMIVSTGLYDFKAERDMHDSPLSLVCKGNYDESRKRIIDRIFEVSEGIHNRNSLFVMSICKPKHISKKTELGSTAIVGKPVHDRDKELCRELIKHGDRSADNQKLKELLRSCSEKDDAEFTQTGDQDYYTYRPTKLIFPEDCPKFVNWGHHILTKLDLSDNSFIEIPEEIYNFVNLTYLSFEKNCLFEISPKIKNLINLKTLKLADNLIEELPSTLESLDQITEEGFSCHNNPITNPPKQTWSQGIDSVRNFFKAARVHKTVKIVKGQIVGLSKAGKTSLIKSLRSYEVQDNFTRKNDRAVGIERSTCSVELDESKELANLILFDFAGQEEYCVTNQLFFSLYVLVFNLSHHKNDHGDSSLFEKQILNWWELIQNRICDPRNPYSTPKVIVVGTHADEFSSIEEAEKQAEDVRQILSQTLKDRRKCAMKEIEALSRHVQELKKKKGADSKSLPKKKDNRSQIQALEKQIKGMEDRLRISIAIPERIIAMSNKEMSSVDAVKKMIKSSLNEKKYFRHLGEELPTPWLRICSFIRDRNRLKKDMQQPMDKKTYLELINDELTIGDRELAIDALKFCRDLGDALYYEDIDVVFLQPQFLVNAFKAVIRRDHREATDFQSFKDHNIQKDQFDGMKNQFVDTGELSERFLRLLWRSLDIESIYEEGKIYSKMICLLEKFDVAYVAKWEDTGRGSKPKTLHVPQFQPCNLPEDFSAQKKEEREHEVQRWIHVADRTNPPDDLLIRLQVRLFKSRTIKTIRLGVSRTEIFFVTDKAVKVYVTTKGTEDYHFRSKDYQTKGLRFRARCENEEDLWSLFFEIDGVIKEMLREWPGLYFEHKVVHTTKKGNCVLEPVQNLETKRLNQIKVHPFFFIGNGSVSNEFEVVDINAILGIRAPDQKTSKSSEKNENIEYMSTKMARTSPAKHDSNIVEDPEVVKAKDFSSFLTHCIKILLAFLLFDRRQELFHHSTYTSFFVAPGTKPVVSEVWAGESVVNPPVIWTLSV